MAEECVDTSGREVSVTEALPWTRPILQRLDMSDAEFDPIVGPDGFAKS